MQTVLRLVEHDRRIRLEDLVGDLEGVEARFSKISSPTSVSRLCSAGRQCRNFTAGFPVAVSSAEFTW